MREEFLEVPVRTRERRGNTGSLGRAALVELCPWKILRGRGFFDH